jgi:hypothetical protein
MKRTAFILCVIALSWITGCKPDDTTPSSTGDIRDKITGGWKCQENSATHGTQNYIVDITKDTLAGKIIIDNFFGLGVGKQIMASVSGQTITISNQTVQGYLFNGSGNIASNFNSISWSYSVDEGNGPETVTAVYTKM